MAITSEILYEEFCSNSTNFCLETDFQQPCFESDKAHTDKCSDGSSDLVTSVQCGKAVKKLI